MSIVQARQTKQKQIIYDALTALDHPTATEVYGYVHGNYPTVSRATVFRVLSGFSTSGKAQELRMAGSEVRYDYKIAPHYHARCISCGKLADVWAEGMSEKGLNAKAECEFELHGYSVEFFGQCKNCRKEQNS